MNYFLFQAINGLAGRWAPLDALAIFSAQYLGYALAGLTILLFYKKWKIIFQTFLASAFAEFVLVKLIRWLWPGPRPFMVDNVNLLIDHAASASFPSGHAAFYTALSIIVYFYNKKAGIGFFIASFLIAISRVFVGVHWPSDVFAGGAVGAISALAVLYCFRKFF